MLVFPTSIFGPKTLKARLEGGTIDGGRTLSGQTVVADVSGGGTWAIEFGEVTLWTREKVMLARALSAALTNGTTPVIVPLADRRHQPITAKKEGLEVPFSDDTLWDDDTPWDGGEVTSTLTANAALGATTLEIAFAGPQDLIGGEHLTILHATAGARLYRIIRIDGNEIVIRPPLREAAANGTELDFDNPRCLCRLDGDFEPGLEMLRFGSAQARFVEWPGNAP